MIRRLILRVLLCPPIRLAGLACFPAPCHFYLSGVGVRAEFLAEMPLCRGHEVVDQPRHMPGDVSFNASSSNRGSNLRFG